MGVLIGGAGRVCAGAGGLWEIFRPLPQFCCESKSALKKKPKRGGIICDVFLREDEVRV